MRNPWSWGKDEKVMLTVSGLSPVCCPNQLVWIPLSTSNKLYRHRKLDRPRPGDSARDRSFLIVPCWFLTRHIVDSMEREEKEKKQKTKKKSLSDCGAGRWLSCNQHLIYAGRRASSADPMCRPFCTDQTHSEDVSPFWWHVRIAYITYNHYNNTSTLIPETRYLSLILFSLPVANL